MTLQFLSTLCKMFFDIAILTIIVFGIAGIVLNQIGMDIFEVFSQTLPIIL